MKFRFISTGELNTSLILSHRNRRDFKRGHFKIDSHLPPGLQEPYFYFNRSMYAERVSGSTPIFTNLTGLEELLLAPIGNVHVVAITYKGHSAAISVYESAMGEKAKARHCGRDQNTVLLHLSGMKFLANVIKSIYGWYHRN